MYQLHLYRSRVLARKNKSYSGFEIIVDHIKQNLPYEKPYFAVGNPGIFRCHLLRNVILEHTDRASREYNLGVCPVLSLRVCKQAGLSLSRGVRSRIKIY